MKPMRRAASLVVALLAAATAAATAAAPGASAADTGTGLGIRLLDAPVARANDPRALVYVVDFVHPGASFTRRVEVRNDTPVAHHVLLYPDSAEIQNGSFVPANGHGVNELTTWMSVSPTSLDLAPRSTAIVRLSIAVPATASAGERYGVLLAEFPPPAGQHGVLLDSRVGVRVYLDVGTGGEPPTNFTIDSLTAGRRTDGTPYVEATVRNTGGRAIDMSGSLRLSDGPGGLSAGPFLARLGTTLAPGQSEPVTVPLDKRIPAGPWRARIDLESGLVKRAAEATITFPTTDGTTAAAVRATSVPLTKNRHVLVPIAVGLLVLVALGLLLLLWKRRRRDDEDDEPRQPVPAAVG